MFSSYLQVGPLTATCFLWSGCPTHELYLCFLLELLVLWSDGTAYHRERFVASFHSSPHPKSPHSYPHPTRTPPKILPLPPSSNPNSWTLKIGMESLRMFCLTLRQSHRQHPPYLESAVSFISIEDIVTSLTTVLEISKVQCIPPYLFLNSWLTSKHRYHGISIPLPHSMAS